MCIIIKKSDRALSYASNRKRNSLFNSLTQAVFDKNMANFWLQKINPLWSVQHGLVQIVKRIRSS